MKYRKQYIPVDIVFDICGRMVPQVIHWPDGHRYEITRLMNVVPAAARKSGGQGDRYTVLLSGQERYLFFERPADADSTTVVGRWFVEAPEVSDGWSS